MEYKIIESLKNTTKTEEMLNQLSCDGWKVVGFTQYQVLLEREKNEDDDQMPLFG